MAGIDAKSDAIYELVEEGSGVEKLATGFTFTEGPIWHPTEQYLLFSDMPGDVRRKYTPDGTVVEVLRPARKCNGMTYDADLHLLVCEHMSSSLVRERLNMRKTRTSSRTSRASQRCAARRASRCSTSGTSSSRARRG